jgi:NADH-quinone oxidoreductase subunit L
VPGLGKVLSVVGLLGAGLTAFYMTRLMALTFAGRFRGGSDREKHLHESPPVMTVPLIALAMLSLVGGVIGLPALTGLPNLLKDFLGPVLGHHGASGNQAHRDGLEVLLMTISTGAAATGMYLGWVFYVRRPELPGLVAARFSRLHRMLVHKYFVDEIYQALFVRPVLRLVTLSGRLDLEGIDGAVNLSSRLTARLSFLIGWEDLQVVDGAVNALAELVQRWATVLRRLQTGRIQDYLSFVALGLFLLAVIVLLI